MRILIVVFLLAIGASFLGGMHPLGDSLAVVRGQMAVSLLIVSSCVFLGRRRVWGRAGIILGLVAGGTVWPGYLMPTEQGEPPLQAKASQESSVDARVYQKNMSYRMTSVAELAEDIRASGAQFVTLQEVDAENKRILDVFAKDFPTRHWCAFNPYVGGVAVASRWPMTDERPVCGDGVAAVQVRAPNGPVWLVGVHLHWPFPYGQAAQVKTLLPVVERLEGTVIVGGDFNMVPYGSTTRAIRRAANVASMPGMRSSFPGVSPLFPLPIDQVWARTVTRYELRPLLGSDHLGVLADVSF